MKRDLRFPIYPSATATKRIRGALAALLFSVVALLLPPRAQAAILSIAPRDGSYDDRFHDRAEWKQWTEEENRHYHEQHVLMGFQGEAYRKPYADAMARWKLSAPPPPSYLAGYRETTFWRERPYRLRTARNPQANTGIPVRGVSNDAALGFVSEYRAILGVATAPEHVYVVRSWQSGLHSFKWYFRQFPPGPERASCRACELKVTIDLRTMRIVEIENTLVDLPVRGLSPPTTDGRDTRKRYLEMRPDAMAGLRTDPATLTYAQDRYGDVGLVWEMFTSRLSVHDGTVLGNYDTWVAIDAHNGAFRGYDIADDLAGGVLDGIRGSDFELEERLPEAIGCFLRGPPPAALGPGEK